MKSWMKDWKIWLPLGAVFAVVETVIVRNTELPELVVIPVGIVLYVLITSSIIKKLNEE